jgi:hypothetical protein
MTGHPVRIICDQLRFPPSNEGSDWHDEVGHHRYYGSSVLNGGERLAETRRRSQAPSSDLRRL